MPIAVSHGEGQVETRAAAHLQQLEDNGLVAMRFVNNYGQVTEQYPANPNGSVNGITSVTSKDGRATIMMPHPERVFRTVSNSWHPENWEKIARGCGFSVMHVGNGLINHKFDRC